MGLSVWAQVYLAAFALLTVFSIRRDVKKGKAAAYLAADALSSLGWMWMIAAYFHPTLIAPFGRGAAVAFLVVLAWTVVDVHRDIAALEPDAELSPRANHVAEMVGICVSALLLSPAIYWGGLAALRAWG